MSHLDIFISLRKYYLDWNLVYHCNKYIVITFTVTDNYEAALPMKLTFWIFWMLDRH